MSIKETLKQIAEIARFYKIDKPYIVGGLPRDIYLQKEIKTGDVDLTTNSADVLRLGVLVADHLNAPFELSDDGHLTIFADEFDIDFSSNFVSDGVLEHIDEDKRKFAEAFSRDFTINALHQDLETGQFFDPTGKAVNDINDKIIRTPVPVNITFTDDPRRAYRAINLAVRYDFAIDPDIVEFVKSNKELFNSEKIKDKYITLKINKALNQDPDKTITLLQALELFENVPLSGQFKDLLIERKMLVDYLGESKMKKEAQMASNWDEYIAQGPEYEKIKDFWEKNYRKFSGYDSPFFNSWANWYMDRYRGIWNHQHKGPRETLELMSEEMSSGITGKPSLLKKFKDQLDNIKMPSFDFFSKKNVDSGNYMDNVTKSQYANVENLTSDLKSFIRVLGNTAKEMGVETPHITSGYRSIESQAQIMYNNWVSNGGIKTGRQYLTGLYGRKYGTEVADVFERYPKAEAVRRVIPVIERYGGRHIQNPAQAIDLRLTDGITDVLYAIEKSGRFNMKLVDERKMAGPHWHITVYKDNGANQRIARMNVRKVELSKIAANTSGKIEGK